MDETQDLEAQQRAADVEMATEMERIAEAVRKLGEKYACPMAFVGSPAMGKITIATTGDIMITAGLLEVTRGKLLLATIHGLLQQEALRQASGIVGAREIPAGLVGIPGGKARQ